MGAFLELMQDIWDFLKVRKKYWLAPLIITIVLMGALIVLGIDNALIEIDNEEIPILDGSAKDFVEKISYTGFEMSSEPIKII